MLGTLVRCRTVSNGMPIDPPADPAAVGGRLVRAALPVLLVAGTLACPRAYAQDLAVLAGVTESDAHTSKTYGWGLEYRQPLLSDLDASLGYLNEGHLPGHYRDGAALRLWGHTQWWQRVDLALGAGPYLYCDTQTYDVFLQSRDYHGVGVIVTGSLRYTLSRDWFAQLELSRITASGSVETRTVLLGVGYRLQTFSDSQMPPGEALPPAADTDAANELGVFYGQTIIDGAHSDVSGTFGVEYRRRVAQHFELSASVLDDGDGLDGRHLGMTGEAWIVQDFFSPRLVLGVGLGAFVGFASYRTVYSTPAAKTLGLASMTASWRFAYSLALRLIWHRGFTGNNQDRDVATLGLDYRL